MSLVNVKELVQIYAVTFMVTDRNLFAGNLDGSKEIHARYRKFSKYITIS
jgi:hypothetical protein